MTRFTAAVVPSAEAIAGLTDEASVFLQGAGVDARAVHHVGLVIDEILTNVATHGGNPDAEATVVLDVHPDRVAGEITDWGKPFDPLTAAPPDTSAPIEQRQIGGLGLHLVRQLTSALGYRRDGERNWTTFCVPRDQGRG